MQQILHLLIVDPDREAALAAWYESRWLLPVLTCAERVRSDRVVVGWLAERGIRSEVVGQWLGRVSPDATDWLMVIRAASRAGVAERQLAWTPVDRLPTATGLIDYQSWAVARTLERGSLPSVQGPFGGFTWLDEVKAWIGASVISTACAVTPYRVTAHEVVLSADTDRGRVYFKGLTQERAREARLTLILAALAPSSFARTMAFDERPDGMVWWLTADCRGNAATDGARVARALARVQRRVMRSGPVIRELQLVDFSEAVRWAVSLVDDRSCAAAIEHALERVAIASVPDSWIPMDLDPTNVLVDGNDVRFIDLDDSFFGPAPLAMALLAKRLRDPSICRVYEQSWSSVLRGVDWPSFERVATVFEAWLGWQRVSRYTKRGEVHGALDLAAARTRERLKRAAHRR